MAASLTVGIHDAEIVEGFSADQIDSDSPVTSRIGYEGAKARLNFFL
jgi:hypothetical protein